MARNAGMFNLVIISPLTVPTAAPNKITRNTGRITGTLASRTSMGPQSTVDSAMMEPMERLIPPVKITTSCATPMIARKEA